MAKAGANALSAVAVTELAGELPGQEAGNTRQY